MPQRNPALDRLLGGLETAIRSAGLEDRTRAEVDRVFDALRTPTAPRPGHRPSRLAVCGFLDEALATARKSDEGVRGIADSFSRLEPSLAWTRRAGSESAGQPFHDGHANAILIGPDGLEDRTGIWLGVSLMSPRVQYPLHRHPPEEIYVVLTPGEWKKADAAWETPGIGGVVHNPSGTVHSMRSHDSPLLAFWLLWSDAAAGD